jgi:hypothetical protein
MKRIIVGLTVLLLAGAGTAAVAVVRAGPAAAAENLVTCLDGSETDFYSPPVTDTTQTIANTGTDTTGSCTWIDGLSESTIYGQASFGGTFDGSCTSVFGPDSGTETWTWYSDSGLTDEIGTSVWNYSSPGVDLNADGQSVEDVEGQIASGMFDGATMDQSLTLTTSLDQCQSGGMSEQDGTFQLEVIGL